MRLSCYQPSQIKAEPFILQTSRYWTDTHWAIQKSWSLNLPFPPSQEGSDTDPWTIVADPAIVTKAGGRVLSLHSLADFFFSFSALAKLFCRNTHPPQTLPNPPPPNLRRISLQPPQINVLRHLPACVEKGVCRWPQNQQPKKGVLCSVSMRQLFFAHHNFWSATTTNNNKIVLSGECWQNFFFHIKSRGACLLNNPSPRYNRNGWLGVKQQVTYLLDNPSPRYNRNGWQGVKQQVTYLLENPSPRYNRNGWQGVKEQVTYLLDNPELRNVSDAILPAIL